MMQGTGNTTRQRMGLSLRSSLIHCHKLHPTRADTSVYQLTCAEKGKGYAIIDHVGWPASTIKSTRWICQYGSAIARTERRPSRAVKWASAGTCQAAVCEVSFHETAFDELRIQLEDSRITSFYELRRLDGALDSARLAWADRS
ncbi:hypothetical protein M404DRAFT_245034 [Pisolithus tinctorius Marx 270]|uniref:Uncharacterized protein n=1 Tax=Pisolithus tinctorius Marx 270 TaxID=870435 RepID=A0A0C3IHH7_PISTI|nr:hypothetical protein M404DRAFT_245034 [Pisolithus tinctorius Marx 270]